MIAPSAYFRQHHAVEAPLIDDRNFRLSYRVVPRLDQLMVDRAIPLSAWYAGIMFRLAAEIVISEDWPSSSMVYADDGGLRDFGQGLRVDARKRLRDIRRALGDRDYFLLELHIVADLDWRELGRRRGVHPKTVRRWTIAALNRLAAIPMF